MIWEFRRINKIFTFRFLFSVFFSNFVNIHDRDFWLSFFFHFLFILFFFLVVFEEVGIHAIEFELFLALGSRIPLGACENLLINLLGFCACFLKFLLGCLDLSPAVKAFGSMIGKDSCLVDCAVLFANFCQRLEFGIFWRNQGFLHWLRMLERICKACRMALFGCCIFLKTYCEEILEDLYLLGALNIVYITLWSVWIMIRDIFWWEDLLTIQFFSILQH